MRIGTIWPGEEFSEGVAGLDEWVETVEAGGLNHVVFGDHVVGIDPTAAAPGWDAGWPGRGPAYTHETLYREPLTVLSYLAGQCSLELMTGVVVAPQRQTALLAKQAAEVDIFSRGRLRLGLGTGWNTGEYRTLGADYAIRGRMLDEQIDLLRRFWTEPAFSFSSDLHTVDGAGIMTLPVQRPIPVWLGGDSAATLRRVGERGDGWFLLGRNQPDSDLRESLATIRRVADCCGRDPEAIGIEARLVVGSHSDRELAEGIDRWRRFGATHLCIDTRYAGIDSVRGHLDSIARAARVAAGAQPG